MTIETKLLGIAGITRRYGIGRSSVYELMAQDKLRAVKFGKKVLIDVASADALFASLPAAKITSARTRPSAS
jgi:hypothetical protein